MLEYSVSPPSSPLQERVGPSPHRSGFGRAGGERRRSAKKPQLQRTIILKRLPAWLAAVAFSSAALHAQPQPVPLTRVHAHNDYLHPPPLFDALNCGFCSVEADVHLVD